MGSKGLNSSGSGDYIITQTNDDNDVEGVAKLTTSNSATDKWFSNPKMSNYDEWVDNLLSFDEKGDIVSYTGNAFSSINGALYDTPWDEMSDILKERATNIYNGINKFELNKAIPTVRKMPMSYLGGALNVDQLREYLTQNPTQQFNGFLSSATGDKPTYGSGNLLVHSVCPPSKGAGAYVRPISHMDDEREFLWNNNSVFNFKPETLRYDPSDGYYHIDADYVGRAKDQHFNK